MLPAHLIWVGMDMTNHKNLPAFGARLQALRRAQRVKQAALAEMLDVEQSTISRWETGIQSPTPEIQLEAFSILTSQSSNDSALRRLVEHSNDATHLIDDASHVCLAFSPRRGAEWRRDPTALIGRPLWGFATKEIQLAEAFMANTGWWDTHFPEPVILRTSASADPQMAIKEGTLIYERLYLADGSPVRLCTSRY